MSDIMRPVPFGELLNRIIGEYRNHRSIFGFSEDQFYQDESKHRCKVFSQTSTTCVGPAAGPHTQLAQNIVTSYLAGARFIELKTVQQMDHLDIAKPCIDARDEGYNTEWSTEFTLSKAWDEYAKAWIICHVLEALHKGKKEGEPDFIFNMSVGYDLAGIKTEKMQQFIDSMMDGRKDGRFAEYLDELDSFLAEGDLFEGSPWAGREARLSGLSKRISPQMVKSVTLSTMHGCPPKEIEAICNYMLTEKKIDTFVKLNPTLLGYDKVRDILDGLGYDYTHLKRESFEKDLQYADAVAMLRRLLALAKSNGRGFGVKLTNTLGSVNDQGQLPGEEMYMSGRALMPISINVAAKLSEEFEGNLPISYSGGANALNITEIFETGIRPITVATDMLHPGGYGRLAQMARLLERSSAWNMKKIDVTKLDELARKSTGSDFQKKSFRGKETVSVDTPLELFDCYVAPCIEACPIHQDIPDYIALVGEGQYAEALGLIYSKNPLPNITGNICDHQCQYHCTRMDYEGAVQIREMKRLAAENGYRQFVNEIWEKPGEPADKSAAVIGAGPAGLSAALMLARAGFKVKVFEREQDAGGVVRHVIPQFRIPEEAIKADVDFIKANGVEFAFGSSMESTKIDVLKAAGFDYIFYGIGTEKDNSFKLKGGEAVVEGALPFLRNFRKNPASAALSGHVIVVGAGDVAMDTARSAMKVPGVTDVTVVYRRSINEMPAEKEEYELAIAEGINFRFLSNPVSCADGTLTVMKMKLGELDASGRKRPEPTGETYGLPCDHVIAAIASHVDAESVNFYGLPCDEKGRVLHDGKTLESKVSDVFILGDMASGPSTVVKCIASARTAVDACIDKVYATYEAEGIADDDDDDDEGCCCDDHEEHEEELSDEEAENLTEEEDAYFADIRSKKDTVRLQVSLQDDEAAFAANEAKRCLECSYLCNKCVEVCPNRANVAIDMRNSGMFEDPFQILHLDAYCNECGNCATFCPHVGAPYKDKFTLFSTMEDFESSENQGFFAEGGDITIREGGKIIHANMDGDGILNGDGPVSDETAALIEEVYQSYSYLLGPVEE